MTKLRNLVHRTWIKLANERRTGKFGLTKWPCDAAINGTRMQDQTSKTRAADALIEHYEAMILEGRLVPGTPMPPEREIVQEHGVSRTVVREAILGLANRGLLKAQPRHRPVVVKPSYDSALDLINTMAAQFFDKKEDVRNLFGLRVTLEAALVREVSLNAKADDIRKLEEALAANKAEIADSSRFYETDIAFHGVLYEIQGNPLLPQIHKAVTGWLSVHWLDSPLLPERNKINYEAHAQIFECILRRDPDQAEAALRSHFEFAMARLEEVFGDT